MAAASGACILCVFYMIFDIRKMVAKKENDWAMSGSPKIEKRISLQEEGDDNIAFDDDILTNGEIKLYIQVFN